jgi:hypothetical protein
MADLNEKEWKRRGYTLAELDRRRKSELAKTRQESREHTRQIRRELRAMGHTAATHKKAMDDFLKRQKDGDSLALSWLPSRTVKEHSK